MNESILLLNDDVWNWIFDCGSWLPPVELLRQWLLWATGPSWFDVALRAAKGNSSLALAWNIGWGLVPWTLFVLPYALVQLIPLVATFHGHNPLHLLDRWTMRPTRAYDAWIRSGVYRDHVRPRWNKLWKLMERVFILARDFDLFGSYVKCKCSRRYRRIALDSDSKLTCHLLRAVFDSWSHDQVSLVSAKQQQNECLHFGLVHLLSLWLTHSCCRCVPVCHFVGRSSSKAVKTASCGASTRSSSSPLA